MLVNLRNRIQLCEECAYWTPTDSVDGDTPSDIEPLGACPWYNAARKASDFCSSGKPKKTKKAEKPEPEEHREPEVFLTREEVAELLGASVQTVDRYRKSSALTCYRVGRAHKMFFAQNDIERFIESMHREGPFIHEPSSGGDQPAKDGVD